MTAPTTNRPAPIELLLVTDEMEAGGTQRQISLLARNVDRTLVRPRVLFFRNPSFLVDELLEAGIETRHLPKRSRFDPVFLWRLRRLLRRGRYDVVHAFSFTAELWSALARLPATRPALVTSVRGRYETFSPLQWRLKAWTARRSRCVVANSEAGASYAAERMGYPLQGIRVVRNGVAAQPAPPQAAARAALGLPEDSVVGLFLGRLVPDKNPASLLRALARLPESGPSFVFLVAGEGPLRSDLETLARERGLQARARFLGERRDAAGLLAAASFVVLPSRREGQSNVLLEAMAAGRAVLASDVPGNREIVTHERNGLLYASGDEEALAAGLRRLIEDEPLRERLAAEGRRHAACHFTVDALVRAMTSIYQECAR